MKDKMMMMMMMMMTMTVMVMATDINQCFYIVDIIDISALNQHDNC